MTDARNPRRACALLAAGLFVIGLVSAAIAGDDGGTDSPLMLGAGARTLSMGGAGSASSDDATALFWNPARLSHLQQGELSLFHTKLFTDDLSYQAGFFTYPSVDFGTVALGFQRLGSSGIDARDDRNGRLDELDFAESHLLLGYGQRVLERLALGATFRLVQQKAGDLEGLGLGLDLGVAIDGRLGQGSGRQWSLGLSLQNVLEPSLQLDQEDVHDPFGLNLGAAYASKPPSSRISWVAAADLDLPSEADPRVGAGVEVGLDQMFFLRGGVDDGSLTAGFGVHVRGIRLDYAMIDRADLPRNDRFTLGFRFGASVLEKRAEREMARQQVVAEELSARLDEQERQALRGARQDAERAFQSGDYNTAIVLFRRVLLLDPEDSEASGRIDAAERSSRMDEADAQREQGELARAAAGYQSILDRWPDDGEAAVQLAAIRERLRAALDRDKQLESLLKVALTHFAANELESARRAFDELLQLFPDHQVAIEMRALVETMRRDQGEAKLTQARGLAGDSRWSSALTVLVEATDLLPERRAEFAALDRDWRARWRQAQLQDEEDRVAQRAQEAPSPSAPIATLSPEREQELDREFRRGLQAFESGDFTGATRIWQSVWQEWPTHASVGPYLVKSLLYEGIELYTGGDYSRAMDLCRRVLEIDPKNEKAARYLINIREEQEGLEELRGRAR